MLILCAARASAQEMPVPVERQIALLTRILPFDREFDVRTENEVVFGIVFQRRYRASLNASEAAISALAQARHIGGKSVRVVLIELEEDTDLGALLDATRVDVIYVTPLRAVDMRVITDATRTRDILTSSGVPDYVQTGGISLGISMRGQKPEILINLPASTEEGARFSSELLKLARVIR